MPAGQAPYEIALSPDGRSVYVTTQVENTVRQYWINGASGELASKVPAFGARGREPARDRSQHATAGGTLTSSCAVSSWGPGRLDAFARGTTNHIHHRWYDNGWQAWEDLGGTSISSPAAVSWGPGRIDPFCIGSDSALWHKYFADRGRAGRRQPGRDRARPGSSGSPTAPG